MIDKLEVVVPDKADFTHEFQSIFSGTRGEPCDPFRSARHYTVTGDLRGFGISAVVHLWSKRGRIPTHKVELLDTGKMSYGEMVNEVERIFDTNAKKLEVRRLDAAADVENLPVTWFHERVRVEYKQWAAKIGKERLGGPTEVEFAEMGKREMQTLYYGKRPNCLRIYNKTAEYRHQYGYFCRDVSPDAELPTFEQVYGIPENKILTRVERQMAGGRVPLQLQTVGRIRANAGDFDPFSRVQFLKAGKSEPRVEDYDLDTWLAGMKLRELCQQQGWQWVRTLINRHGNGRRVVERFRDFLPEDPAAEQTAMDLGTRPAEQIEFPGCEKFDSRALFERYRESVHRQLAA